MTRLTPLITVCVCTYKRPSLLNNLLDSLAIQEHTNFDFEIVIVDNDGAGSARNTVDEFSAKHSQLKISYSIEPQQGISFARNRTVAMAVGDLLAFIDDDEIASTDWLQNSYQCLTVTQADAVVGPVIPVYPPNSKAWVIKSCVFERVRYPDRTRIGSDDGRTGNALVRSHWCKQRTPHCFKESLGRSGGEDHEFFKWLESSGSVMIWSDTSTVTECVPMARQRIGFVLERRFRASVTYWRNVNETRSKWGAITEAAKGVVGGTACLALGGLSLPIGLAITLTWWIKAVNGFARLAALSNIQLIGYGTPDV